MLIGWDWSLPVPTRSAHGLRGLQGHYRVRVQIAMLLIVVLHDLLFSECYR